MSRPSEVDRYVWRDMHRIKGWLSPVDAELLRALAGVQDGAGVESGSGLAEIGVYHGRSAILLGHLARPGERVWMCDLFDAPGAAEDRLSATYYGGATVESFLGRWHRYHADEPTVVVGSSRQLAAELPMGELRLVHVDAGHEFDDVVTDLEVARESLAPHGVVVIDDWRTEHSPGVGAAAWRAVYTQGLGVLALTEAKMYASWGGASLRAPLHEAVEASPWLVGTRNEIGGQPVSVVRPSALARRRKVERIVPVLKRRFTRD